MTSRLVLWTNHHCLPYSSEVISSLVELAYTGATCTINSIVKEQVQMAYHYNNSILPNISRFAMTFFSPLYSEHRVTSK